MATPELKLAQAAARIFTPPPDLTVSQWADAERRLSPESSAEPGRWNTDRAPYLREPMDVCSDSSVQTVVMMMASQTGKTELTLNVIGYHIHQDPSPILLVQSSLELAEAYSKDRLAPMIRDTPALKGKVKDVRSRDSGNTLLHKKFPGGQITLSGANSPSSLASRPVRIVLTDEVDRYPFSAGTEGDPVLLAQARAETFHNSKFIVTSTPLIDGSSRIQTAFKQSDQRHFYVPCPKCQQKQVLKWPQMKWDIDEDGWAKNVRYECTHCHECFEESEKEWMLLQGQWIAHAPFNGTAGFHVSSLYSPWKRWTSLVDEWLKAQGNREMLKVFINTKLAETWKEKGEAPEWERIYHGRESYKQGTVPSDKIGLVTAGIDIQKDRIEMEVVGWAKNKESWSIDYVVLHGDTSTDSSPIWDELDEAISRTYVSESGQEFQAAGIGIDTGYATQTVYTWVRRHSSTRVFAMKGKDTLHQAFSRPQSVDVNIRGKTVKNGVQLWTIGVSHLKSELYAWLKQKRPTQQSPEYPSGYCHFPEYGEEYFRMLTAEQIKRKKNSAGYTKVTWEKVSERNEALDCRVYARAAASIMGIDRFNDSQWERLRTKFQKVPIKGQGVTNAPRQRRRFNPGWL